MMIGLTDAVTDDKIYINTRHILAIKNHEDNLVRIIFKNGEALYVKDTTDLDVATSINFLGNGFK